MSALDPQMRVATSGERARCKHYSESAATAGLFLQATGEDGFPVWAAAGGADITVNRVLFVDGSKAPAGANGSLNHPFTTIGTAITQLLANNWSDGILIVAPGTYIEDVTIPFSAATGDILIQGWDQSSTLLSPGNLPQLQGNITLDENITLWMSNMFVNGALIMPPNPAADMHLRLTNSTVLNEISGDHINLTLVQSDVQGPITGTTDTVLTSDGYSWARLVQNLVAIAPYATYTRTFLDTGADEFFGSVVANGLAIGDAVTVALPYPTARPGEYAIINKVAPIGDDCTLTFDHTDVDEVYVRVRNDSRASTNFNEPVTIVCFHANMAQQPAP